MKRCYIMRGLPGSGKSTIARRLAGPRGLVASADDFFMRGCRYEYDRAKQGDAHAWNLRRFRSAVLAEVPVIVVDNTNVRREHFAPYADFAAAHGYDVEIVTLSTELSDAELAARNVHGVPIDVIAYMREAWEDA